MSGGHEEHSVNPFAVAREPTKKLPDTPEKAKAEEGKFQHEVVEPVKDDIVKSLTDFTGSSVYEVLLQAQVKALGNDNHGHDHSHDHGEKKGHDEKKAEAKDKTEAKITDKTSHGESKKNEHGKDAHGGDTKKHEDKAHVHDTHGHGADTHGDKHKGKPVGHEHPRAPEILSEALKKLDKAA